jgi:hypothetical protein
MDGIMSLINSTEYAGFTIKEWNIVQFSRLSSVLSEVAREYKSKNLSWDSFSAALSTTSENGMLNLSQNVLDVLEPFTKHAPTILTISCKASVEQLEKIAFTDGIVLLLLVLKFNMEHLSRFFVNLVGTTNSEPATTASTESSNS